MLPRLLHPINVLIKKADRLQTFYDQDLHEPIGQVRRPQKPVVVWAQIKVLESDDPKASVGGVLENTRGYILLRTADLLNKHFTVERGDQIIQIGEGDYAREVDYYITRLQQRGHYPRAKGHTLIKAWFADRHPSRQQGDL